MNLEDKKLAKALGKVFPVLTETNKKIVIDMTKFLVQMQNVVIPAILRKEIKICPKKEI